MLLDEQKWGGVVIFVYRIVEGLAFESSCLVDGNYKLSKGGAMSVEVIPI